MKTAMLWLFFDSVFSCTLLDFSEESRGFRGKEEEVGGYNMRYTDVC